MTESFLQDKTSFHEISSATAGALGEKEMRFVDVLFAPLPPGSGALVVAAALTAAAIVARMVLL